MNPEIQPAPNRRFATAVPLLLVLLGLVGLAAGPAAADTFTINNVGDEKDVNPGNGVCETAVGNGACTLRAAIMEGNARAGDHILNFTPGMTITFGSSWADLPPLNAKYFINGNLATIDGQYVKNSKIGYGCLVLSDSGTAALGHGNGATGTVVTNLAIIRCNGAGISANGHDYTFIGNRIGVDATGLTAYPNSGDGINLTASAYYPTNTTLLDIYGLLPPSLQPVDPSQINQFQIGVANALLAAAQPIKVIGNVISGNDGHGIEIHGINMAAVFVSGNHIGTNLPGTSALPNGGSGVHLNASAFGNMIGPDNVISGNLGHGVWADSAAVLLPNFIVGNRIGLGNDPSAHVGNGQAGIFVSTSPDSGNPPNPAQTSLVIGPSNVISDNQGTNAPTPDDVNAETGAGIVITGTSSGVKVLGNTIGLAEFPPGTPVSSTDYGNAGDGIIVTSSGNVIGGSSPTSANVIAGNLRHGIVVKGSGTSGTDIRGNFIGVSPSLGGLMTLGNGYDGIHVDRANASTIGGPNAGDANVVAANGRNGIALRNGSSSSGWGNLFQRNRVFGNGRTSAGVGIDLEHPADQADAPDHSEYPSTYANGDQVQPLVCAGPGDPGVCNGAAAPASAGGTTTVTWTMATHGGADFRIELFAVNAGSGNGATSASFLGEATVSTDAAGTLTATSGNTTCTGSLPGRCTTTVGADAGGSSLLLSATDVTQIPTAASSWFSGLTCFLGLVSCPINNSSELSNEVAIPLPAEPVMASVPAQSARVGLSFSLDLSAYTNPNGAAVTYAVTGGALPNGLGLNTATGLVSGTPTAAGPFTATIQATNANGTTHAPPISFTVAKGEQVITFGNPPVLVMTPLTTGNVSATVSSSLPLTFASTTTSVCTIAGTLVTPVAAGTCVITANQAGNASWNKAPQASQSIQVSAVPGPPPSWSGLPLSPSATVGVAFSLSLASYAVQNPAGDPILSYAVTSGTLPAGLTLDPATGLISGTPTTVGSPSVQVKVSDKDGASAAGTLSFTVAQGSQSIVFSALADRVLGTPPFTVSATATSGLAVTFTSLTPTKCTVSGATVTLVAAGACTVHATQAGNASWGAATPVDRTFNVTAPAVTGFSVTGAPGATTAGTPFSLTVTAHDAGNATTPGYLGSVHFTSSDAAATLPGDYTFTVADAGVHTFTGVVLSTPGSSTVTVTDKVLGTVTGSTGAVVVSAGPAATFTVAVAASATAGVPVSVTVTARDAGSNVATGYTGTVHFTSTDSGAGTVLPSNYTFTAGDAGVHTFTNGVTLTKAGSQTVTATDTVTATLAGTSGAVVVAASTATQLAVTAPASATAGASFSVTVAARDAYANTATGYTGTVHFTSTDAAGSTVLPASYTFVAGDSGTHTFTNGVNLKTAGSQTVTATDTGNATVTGTSGAIAVAAAAVAKLAVTAPASATSGTAFTVSVAAQDAFGNVTPAYTGTVHFTSTDAAGTVVLPASYTFVAGDSGQHAFANGATLVSAGSQAITATDTVTASITGTSGAIVVGSGAATHLSVTAPPAAASGTAFTVTVTARDAASNVATGYTGTVHFTTTDAAGAVVLPANYTFVAGDAGVHTFTSGATLVTSASQTVTATDTVTASITGTSGAIAVGGGAATHLSVSAPASVAAATAFTVTVTALDAANNTAPGYTGTIHFTSTDPSATLPADYTFTAGDAGVHAFPTAKLTSGSRTITATDTVTASITGTSASIAVTAAGSATALAGPSSSVRGQNVSLTATVTPGSPGTVTGTVDFLDGAAAVCSTVAVNGSAQAACSTAALAVGPHSITARYNGDANYAVSTSAPLALTVSKASTTTTITAHTPSPSTSLQPLTVSATVAAVAPGAGTPTGTITVGATTLGTCDIVLPATSCVLAPRSAGAMSLTADYLGDADFATSTATPVPHQVDAVTVFAAQTATGTGQATATVSGAGCTFTQAQFIGLGALTPPSGTSFPHGLFDFQVGGCGAGATATIQVVYPAPALAVGAQYWKYGPLSGQPTGWYPLLAGAPNNASIAGSTVTFTITDGGKGDDDLVPNGLITDQGGVGVPALAGAQGESIPTLGGVGLAALALLLGAAGVAFLRRNV